MGFAVRNTVTVVPNEHHEESAKTFEEGQEFRRRFEGVGEKSIGTRPSSENGTNGTFGDAKQRPSSNVGPGEKRTED